MHIRVDNSVTRASISINSTFVLLHFFSRFDCRFNVLMVVTPLDPLTTPVPKAGLIRLWFFLFQIKKRHPSVKQLRDASLAWVCEIEGEVNEKVKYSMAVRRYYRKTLYYCYITPRGLAIK